MPSLPPSIAPLGRDPPASPDALEDALLTLTQLRDELQGPDCCLASRHLELVSGWLRSNAVVRVAWSQAITASTEGERAAGLAGAARDVALKDAKAAEE